MHMFNSLRNSSNAELLRSLLYAFQMVLPNNVRFYVTRNNSTSVSSLDDYTSNLVKEKSLKWLRIAKETNSITNPLKACVKDKLQFRYSDNLQTCIDIKSLPVGHIDTLLADVLRSQNVGDLKFLIQECILYDKLPSIHMFLDVLSFYSKQGLKDDVEKLRTFLQKCDPKQFSFNGNLNHFLAEVSWVCGNIEEAINIFIDSYSQYPQMKPKIQNMVRYMATELICKGSEAKLVMMTKFATLFVSRFNDYHLLCTIWELAFLSKWYSDQMWALDLLKQNPELLNLVKHKFLSKAIKSLQKHDMDTVQRILELMLAAKMRQQYKTLLHALFEYKYLLRDLRGCTEVMNVAITQGIPMCGSQQIKLVQLLLGKDIPKVRKESKKISVPKYILKF